MLKTESDKQCLSLGKIS